MQEAVNSRTTSLEADPSDQANDIDFLVASLRETVRLMAQGEPVGADSAAAWTIYRAASGNIAGG